MTVDNSIILVLSFIRFMRWESVKEGRKGRQRESGNFFFVTAT